MDCRQTLLAIRQKCAVGGGMNMDQFLKLIPKATLWAKEQEKQILTSGVSLLTPQLEDAKIIPIKYPERIRLLRVSRIPLPEDPELNYAAQTIQLITPNTVGMSFQYGIYIRNDYWNNREILVHELVHTAQYERLGGSRQFLEQYLRECIEYGYPQAPLEQEAINKAKNICI